MPKFAQYSKEFGENYNFAVVNCDFPENRALVEEYHIMGFPSLFMVDKKLDFQYQINSIATIDKDVMKKELNKYLNLRNKALKN